MLLSLSVLLYQANLQSVDVDKIYKAGKALYKIYKDYYDGKQTAKAEGLIDILSVLKTLHNIQKDHTDEKNQMAEAEFIWGKNFPIFPIG